MNTPIRIVLIDDHELITGPLAMRVRYESDFDVVGTAIDAPSGLQLIRESRPDIAVIDIRMGKHTGFDLAAQIQHEQSLTRITFLTGYWTDAYIYRAQSVNAVGYFVKTESTKTLLANLRLVAAGEVCFSPSVLERMQFNEELQRFQLRPDSPIASLTSRQIEVLQNLARGQSSRLIASNMHLSEKSIDSHKYRIMQKLGMHNSLELVRFAMDEGLTDI